MKKKILILLIIVIASFCIKNIYQINKLDFSEITVMNLYDSIKNNDVFFATKVDCVAKTQNDVSVENGLLGDVLFWNNSYYSAVEKDENIYLIKFNEDLKIFSFIKTVSLPKRFFVYKDKIYVLFEDKTIYEVDFDESKLMHVSNASDIKLFERDTFFCDNDKKILFKENSKRYKLYTDGEIAEVDLPAECIGFHNENILILCKEISFNCTLLLKYNLKNNFVLGFKLFLHPGKNRGYSISSDGKYMLIYSMNDSGMVNPYICELNSFIIKKANISVECPDRFVVINTEKTADGSLS